MLNIRNAKKYSFDEKCNEITPIYLHDEITWNIRYWMSNFSLSLAKLLNDALLHIIRTDLNYYDRVNYYET